MTLEELYELTDTDFDFYIWDKENADQIAFGVPIPAPYGNNLSYSMDENGLQLHSPIEEWEEAWNAYINDLRTKKRHRTARKAKAAGAITQMPDRLAIITYPKMEYSISERPNDTAYLQLITPDMARDLQYQDGALSFPRIDDSRATLVTDAMQSGERAISDTEIDLPLIRVLYSIILQDVEHALITDPGEIERQINDKQFVARSVRIHVPALLYAIGLKHYNNRDITNYVGKIMRMNRIMGIMIVKRDGREYKNYYSVMQTAQYIESQNIIEISSPYLNKLIAEILSRSVQRDKRDRIIYKRNGQPQRMASHSYLVKSSITKEKNKTAIEMTNIIVTLIEQAGDNIGQIKASTIIDRCPMLAQRLSAAKTTRDKNDVLKRAFSGTWKLLRSQTYLTEVYEDIQLPPPDLVPTTTNLDMVFQFPHKGKRNNNQINT